MKIGIIGSGQFGVSLAHNFSKNLKEINIWNRSNINKDIISIGCLYLSICLSHKNGKNNNSGP